MILKTISYFLPKYNTIWPLFTESWDSVPNPFQKNLCFGDQRATEKGVRFCGALVNDFLLTNGTLCKHKSFRSSLLKKACRIQGQSPWANSAECETPKGLGGKATNLFCSLHSSVSCCENTWAGAFLIDFPSEGVQGATRNPPAYTGRVRFTKR